ncbi:MAG: cell envelope integrity protein TolA [Burkholderiaceae bacterium]|nr:cell envelope integrity protein TolA [Burkholderiaceae bacterium]
MPSHAERIDFMPPPQPGAARAFGIALAAHAVLIAALTWGVNWKNTNRDAAIEAELWSTVVQQAAPRPVETPPAPTPPPAPPAPRTQTAPPPEQNRDADIALEREKRQREERERREAEQKRQAADKAAREKKAATEKAAADKKAAEKAAADKKRDQEAKKREEQQEKLAEAKRREENLKRIQAMAGATGSADATGNSQRSSGPSAGYAERLAALFKRNISFPNPDSISGNPKAVVEVRVSPSGLIIGSRLVKSSGVPAWDDAVLRAVDKTERIPADNGRYPTVFPAEFGPKD